MLRRLRELAAHQQSFAFESTLATRSYATWISHLSQGGYEFIPPEEIVISPEYLNPE
jgi:predicted ABC-type ATPase